MKIRLAKIKDVEIILDIFSTLNTEKHMNTNKSEIEEHIKQNQPDVNLTMQVELNSGEEDVEIPINLNFFWPDL